MSDKNVNKGNIENSAVAFGRYSRASNWAAANPLHEETANPLHKEAVNLLAQLIELLGPYQADIPEAEQVQESAVLVQDELDKEKPNRHLIRSLLAGIAASVSTVAALASAVDHIQDVVLRLFS